MVNQNDLNHLTEQVADLAKSVEKLAKSVEELARKLEDRPKDEDNNQIKTIAHFSDVVEAIPRFLFRKQSESHQFELGSSFHGWGRGVKVKGVFEPDEHGFDGGLLEKELNPMKGKLEATLDESNQYLSILIDSPNPPRGEDQYMMVKQSEIEELFRIIGGNHQPSFPNFEGISVVNEIYHGILKFLHYQEDVVFPSYDLSRMLYDRGKKLSLSFVVKKYLDDCVSELNSENGYCLYWLIVKLNEFLRVSTDVSSSIMLFYPGIEFVGSGVCFDCVKSSSQFCPKTLTSCLLVFNELIHMEKYDRKFILEPDPKPGYQMDLLCEYGSVLLLAMDGDKGDDSQLFMKMSPNGNTISCVLLLRWMRMVEFDMAYEFAQMLHMWKDVVFFLQQKCWLLESMFYVGYCCFLHNLSTAPTVCKSTTISEKSNKVVCGRWDLPAQYEAQPHCALTDIHGQRWNLNESAPSSILKEDLASTLLIRKMRTQLNLIEIHVPKVLLCVVFLRWEFTSTAKSSWSVGKDTICIWLFIVLPGSSDTMDCDGDECCFGWLGVLVRVMGF